MSDNADLPRPDHPDKGNPVQTISKRAAQVGKFVHERRATIAAEARHIARLPKASQTATTWQFDTGAVDKDGVPYEPFPMDEESHVTDHDLEMLREVPSSLEVDSVQNQAQERKRTLREDTRSAIDFVQTNYGQLLTDIESDGSMRREITDAYINNTVTHVLDESGIAQDESEQFVGDLKQYLQKRDTIIQEVAQGQQEGGLDDELRDLTGREEVRSLLRT